MIVKLFLATVFITTSSLAQSKDIEVYICKSINAKKYHLTKNCHALKRCNHEIIKMNIVKAKKIGTTLCGHEKKKIRKLSY